MDLSAQTIWWAAAGATVAAELLTGTFYLLMIALGLAAAAVAARLGFASSGQVIVAALIGGGATALWHWQRVRQPRSLTVAHNRDAHLDIGERIQVEAWAADRTARVTYRGSRWIAKLPGDAATLPGPHVIVAVEGNWLVLSRIEP